MIRVLGRDELWEGEMLGIVVAGVRLLLVRAGGAVHAYRDRCAHLGVRLSDGSLEGRVLTCRAHGWQYDVTTGRGVNPAGCALAPLPVREDAAGIHVEIEEVVDAR